ncbi:MAG: glyceraldehyde 3-phosphate dehydrogenase NAD-binding domain-containing protein [Planctomycetota bacterium]
MNNILGINGLGRIGKMTVWHHLARRHYDRLVVNLGRRSGHGMTDIAEYISCDSTYGSLAAYLHGVKGTKDYKIVSEERGEMILHGMPIKVLREQRDPRMIPWREEGVKVVVDTTGKFTNPADPEDFKGGSLRGHLAAGAELVILSAAFKLPPTGLPEDAVFLVYGANHHMFQPTRHRIVSAASCTTTALAHMLLPLLNDESTSRLVTAGMSTVHATTQSQSILDNVPKDKDKDMRRNRSFMDNIILTTTNAAKALEWVIPEVKGIGFLADSVRVPTDTVSLIILNCTFQTEITSSGDSAITRETINNIYRNAMENGLPNLVEYSDRPNVSVDMKGRNAAVVIEGTETHTRTGFLKIVIPDRTANGTVDIPVTHAKIFGWYDNELGSYANRLGDLTTYLNDNL